MTMTFPDGELTPWVLGADSRLPYQAPQVCVCGARAHMISCDLN